MQLSIHKAQTSILTFGIIMIGQGLFLVIAPNVLLQLLGIEDAKDYWVRFVGVALLVLSIYYIRSSFENLRSFFFSTVLGRIFQFVLIFILYLVYHFSPVLVGFSFFEFLTGMWTFYCLKVEK